MNQSWGPHRSPHSEDLSEKQRVSKLLKIWHAWADSNRRPLVPETSAQLKRTVTPPALKL